MDIDKRDFEYIIDRYQFFIPKYQRSYCWGKDDWGFLLDDIMENESAHFIGSMICEKQENENIYEVVDGQQRLTTLSLLMAAIYKNLEDKLNKKLNEKIENKKIRKLTSASDQTENRLVTEVESKPENKRGIYRKDGECFQLKVIPSSQDHNLDDYAYIMSECKLIDNVKKPEGMEKRLMHKAYTYFDESLKTPKYDQILKKLLNLQLIFVSANEKDNAYNLFDTLNNRGSPLNAVDIIKNEALKIIDKKESNIDDAYQKWKDMLDNIKGYEDLFLKHFYNAFKHELKPKLKELKPKLKNIEKATQPNLIKIYYGLLKDNPTELLDDLLAKSKTYNKIIKPYEDEEFSNKLLNIQKVQANTSNILLLYLMELGDKHVSPDALINIASFIEKYYVRRNITGTPPTNTLDQMQIDTIKACENKIKEGNKIKPYFIVENYFKNKKIRADLNRFKESIKGNLFASNKAMTRYILIKIAEKGKTNETGDFWAKGRCEWTIEHILPQKDNSNNDWLKRVADGNKEEYDRIKKSYLHCLGNLTLSGYNANLKNNDFDYKQNKKDKNGNDIGYKNGIYLNNKIKFDYKGKPTSLAEIETWNEETIKRRNEVMVRLVCELNLFEGESLDELDK